MPPQPITRRGALRLLGAASLAAAAAPATARAAAAPAAARATAAGAGGQPAASPGGRAQGAAVAGPTAARGVLGANYNGDLELREDELRAAAASWLRGFVTLSNGTDRAPAFGAPLRAVLDASARGYGTVLTLRYAYSTHPLPAPGSSALATELRRLDAVLAQTLDRVDAIAIGNEPFLESRRRDRGAPLLRFYRTLAEHAIAVRARRSPHSATRLYLGALTVLEHGASAGDGDWLALARDLPGLAGVDIHPHVRSLAEAQRYLAFVLPRLRRDQTFLATEFSLVRLWRAHMGDAVPAAYAARYGVAPTQRVWQAIVAALAAPFPQAQWDDLCALSPWYAANRHYVRDQMTRFRATGRLAVATYGFRQAPRDGADPERAAKAGWLLNRVFAPLTVEPAADGLSGRGYAWLDDFRASQRPQDRRPIR